MSILAFSSCQEEKLNPTSIITLDNKAMNAFDEWLMVNYREPYNIDFKYRYEMNESDMSYYTVPARYDCSIIMAHLVKYLCIETYDEVAGINFTRAYFPKMFFLIGEWEYNNNGSFILGTAEGGKKIMLSGLNYLPEHLKSADELNHYYIKTIHHEFTHILNQTKEYPADFKLITGTGYVADKCFDHPYDTSHLRRGFITDYSQHSDTEDFAEMMSEYVTHPAEWWQHMLDSAGTDAASLIRTKEQMVRNYMQGTFNIDIDDLRATIQRRQNEVMDGKVDLSDISIK